MAEQKVLKIICNNFVKIFWYENEEQFHFETLKSMSESKISISNKCFTSNDFDGILVLQHKKKESIFLFFKPPV